MVRWVKHNEIPYMPGVNAAFFLLVNLGEAYPARHAEAGTGTELDEHIMQSLLRRMVFLALGNVFGSERPGWFCNVHSQPKPALEEGLRGMVVVLGD